MGKPKIVSFVRYPVDRFINTFSHRIDPSKVEFVVVPPALTEDEVCKVVEGATILLKGPGKPFLSRRMLEAARAVKLVQFGSVGYEAIDLEAANDLMIPVANNPGWNAISVAEHAVMSMLVLLKKAFYAHHAITQGRWVHGEIAPSGNRQVFELHGKTVGILGLGSIGTEVAKRVRVFGAHVFYNKRNRLSKAEEDERGVEYCTFEQLLEHSDILTVHVPLTDETRGMIGRDEIARMKEGAILINTARREIVDEAALAEALREGRLLGAAIDVPRQPEMVGDLQGNFAGIKNILLTPHIATSKEAMARAFRQVNDNIYRVLKGKKPLYLVNDVWR